MSKIDLLGNVGATANVVSSATKDNTIKGPKFDLFGGVKSASKAAELGELPTWDASGDLFKRYNNLDLENYNKYFEVGGQSAVPAVSVDALNEGRARHQSTMAQIGNGLGKAGVTFVSAIGENTVGLLAGTSSALMNWDFSKLYDNKVSNVFQNMNDWAQEAMPNYNTREMEHAGFFEQLYNPGKGVANFWADKFANGFAYTAAAIATLYATGGYGAIGIAGNTLKAGTKGLAHLAKQGGKAAVKEAGKQATKKTIRQGVRQGVKDLATKQGTKQAFKNLDAAMTMAWAESSIEARDTYETAYGSLLQQYMDENGFVDESQVPAEMQDTLRGEAQSASNVNFVANLAIVGTTDLFMFGRMVNGYKPKIKFNPLSGTGKAAVDATLIEGSKLSKMRRIWRNTKAYGASAGTEMTQEGLQYVSNNAITDYYLDKNSDGGQADAINSLGKAFEDLYTTKEGKESMLLGFLTGGISTIKGTSKDLANKDANTENLINRVHQNFLKESREKIEKREKSARYTYLMDQAENEGDLEAFEEAHQALLQNEIVTAIDEGTIEHLKEKVADSAELSDEQFSEEFGIDVEAVKLDKSSYTSKLLKKIERTQQVYEEATQAFAPKKQSGILRWTTNKLAPQELALEETRNENMNIFRNQYFNSVMAMDNLDATESKHADMLNELTKGELNYKGMRDLIETTAQEEALNDKEMQLQADLNKNLDDAGKVIDQGLNTQLVGEIENLRLQRAELLDTLSAQHEKTFKGEFDKQFMSWESKVSKQKGRIDDIAKARKAKVELDAARFYRLQAVQAFNSLQTEDGRTALLEEIGRVEKLRRNDKHSGALMREAQEMGMSHMNEVKLYRMANMPGLNEKARKAIRKKQADILRMAKRYRTMFSNMSDQQLVEALNKYSNAYIRDLIGEELSNRAEEARIERDLDRIRVEEEQRLQQEKDNKDKQDEKDRQDAIIKEEIRRRENPHVIPEEHVDDIDVITHTNPKLQELDQKIAELERLVSPQNLTATPEVDRIAALDETLDEKGRAFIDLMRKKGKDQGTYNDMYYQNMIDAKIKSEARKTAAGNQLLTRYKAEDTLQNPEGKKLGALVAAYSLLYTDRYIPEATINDTLYSYPDLRTQNLGDTASNYGVQQAVLGYEAWAERGETIANLKGQRISILAMNKSKKQVVPKNPSNETAKKKGQLISRNGQYINEDPSNNKPIFDENSNVTNHRSSVTVKGQELKIHRELLTDPDIATIGTEVTLRVLPTDEWSKLASDTEAAETKYPEYSTIPVGIFMTIEGKEILVGTLGNHQGDAEFTAERQRIYNNWKAGKDTVAVIKEYETDTKTFQPSSDYNSSKAVSNNDIQNYRDTEGNGIQKSSHEMLELSEQSYGQPVIGVIAGHSLSDEGSRISLGMNAPDLNTDEMNVPKTSIEGSVGMITQDPNGYDLFIPMQTRNLTSNAIDVIIGNAQVNKIKSIEEITFADYNMENLKENGYYGSVVPGGASTNLANTFYKILAKKSSDGSFIDSTHIFYTPFNNNMILVGASANALKANESVKMYEITDKGDIKVVVPQDQPAGLPNANEAMRDMLSRKKYQVDASRFNNTNLQYVSPVTGITHDNYQKYLISEEEGKGSNGETEARLNAAEGSTSAILGSDVYVRNTSRPLMGPHRSIHSDVNIAMYLPELDNFKGKESDTDMADPITSNDVITEGQEKLLEKQIADMLNIPTFDPSQIDFTGGVIPGPALETIEEEVINKEANRFKKEQEKKQVDPIKTNESKIESSVEDVLDNDIDNIPDADGQTDGIIGNNKKC